MRRSKDDKIFAALLVLILLTIYNTFFHRSGMVQVVQPGVSEAPTPQQFHDYTPPSPTVYSASAKGPPSPTIYDSQAPQAPPPIINATVGRPAPFGQSLSRGARVLHVQEYLAGLVVLQRNKEMALTPDQVRKIGPIVRKYRTVYRAVPDAQRVLEETLTAEQLKFIKENPTDLDPSTTAQPAEIYLGPIAEKAIKAMER